jgi:pyridoxine 5-phosphate synthase
MCARAGIKLSLFVEADNEQLTLSRAVGARQVELHTGRYAEARGSERAEVLTRLAQAARFAQKLGLEVAAGHGLTRENVPAIAAIWEIEELNIGHAIICEVLVRGSGGARHARSRAAGSMRAARRRAIA